LFHEYDIITVDLTKSNSQSGEGLY